MVDVQTVSPPRGAPPIDPVLESEFEAPLLRRAVAEFVGTLLLVAVGAGAATVFTLGPLREFSQFNPQLITSPDQAPIFQGLLANTLGDVLGVALAFALVLAVLVYAFGGVSGGHFNPAVTFALALSRRFRWRDLPVYWVAQVLGGIAGALVILGIFSDQGVVFTVTEGVSENILLGATTIADGVNDPQALLSEAFIGFLLMTAIMAVAIDPRAPKGWSGLTIGLALAAGIMVTATTTGGSANFARSLGPFVASFMKEGITCWTCWPPGTDSSLIIPWRDLAIYAGGPLIGASAAALLYESITGLERVSPAPHPGAATPPMDAMMLEAEEQLMSDDVDLREPGPVPPEWPEERPGGPDDRPGGPLGPEGRY